MTSELLNVGTVADWRAALLDRVDKLDSVVRGDGVSGMYGIDSVDPMDGMGKTNGIAERDVLTVKMG